MPTIPRFRSNVDLPSVPQARRVGQTMDIGITDAMFEQASSGARQIERAGQQAGQSIERAGAEVSNFLKEETARRDKGVAVQGSDEFNERLANYIAKQPTTLTDPKTGAYTPEAYGMDMDAEASTWLQDIREKYNMNDIQFGILTKMANHRTSLQAQQNSATRGKLIIADTNQKWEEQYIKALQNNDPVMAMVGLEQWAKGDPKIAQNFNHYRDNIANTIWHNQFIETMKKDPNNNDPRKLELSSIPDTVGGAKEKQKYKDNLVKEYDKEMSYRMKEEAEYKFKMQQDIVAKMEEGISDEWFNGLGEGIMVNGRPYFSNKEIANFKRNNQLIRQRKKRDYKISEAELINDTLFDTASLDYSEPKLDDKIAKLSTTINEIGDFRALRTFQNEVARGKKNHQIETKMPKEQKKELTTIMNWVSNMDNVALFQGSMQEMYNEDDEPYLGYKLNLVDREDSTTGEEYQVGIVDERASMKLAYQLRSRILDWASKQTDLNPGDIINYGHQLSKPYLQEASKRKYVGKYMLGTDRNLTRD